MTAGSMTLSSQPTTIHRQNSSRHVSCGFRSQENYRSTEVRWFSPPRSGYSFENCASTVRVIAKRSSVVGRYVTGRDRIDRYSVLRPFVRQSTSYPCDSMLRCRVAGHVDAALETHK